MIGQSTKCIPIPRGELLASMFFSQITIGDNEVNIYHLTVKKAGWMNRNFKTCKSGFVLDFEVLLHDDHE